MSLLHRTRRSVSTQLVLVPIAVLSITAIAVGATAARNSVGTAQLRANSVTSAKLAPRAVTGSDLAPNAVTGAAIRNRSVSGSDLATAAVGASQLADGAVTTAKLAAGSVTSASIADGAITAAKLAPGAVTAFQLSAGDVTESIIASGAVTTTKLGDGAVTTSKLAAGAVTTDTLAAGAAASSMYARTFLVRSSDDVLDNGTRLVAAAADAVALGEPALVALEPGTYDLGAASITLTDDVSLVGSGAELTTITSTSATATIVATGTVEAVHVVNEAASTAIAVDASGSAFRLVDAHLEAGTGLSATAIALDVERGLVHGSTIESTSSGGGSSRAIRTASTGELRIVGSTVIGGGNAGAVGIFIPDHASLLRVEDSTIAGGTAAIRVQSFSNGDPVHLRSVVLDGSVDDTDVVADGNLVAMDSIFRGDRPEDTWDGPRRCFGSHTADSSFLVGDVLDDVCVAIP